MSHPHTPQDRIAKKLGITPCGLSCLAKAVANDGIAEGRGFMREQGSRTMLAKQGLIALNDSKSIDGGRVALRLLNGGGLAVARLSEVSRKLFASPREGLLAHKRVLRSIAQVMDGAPRAASAYGAAMAWGDGGVFLDRPAAAVLAEMGRAFL